MKPIEIPVWSSKSKYDLGKYDHVHNVVTFKNGVKGTYGDSLDVVKMSCDVRDRFNAIDVAVSLSREHRVMNRLYVPSSFKSIEDREATIIIIRGIHLPVVAPCYLWTVQTESMYIYFILSFEEDFNLKYPVDFFGVHRNYSYNHFHETLKNEKVLIEKLEGVLSNV